MLNIFEALRDSPEVRKFRIGDLLFAEVTCPVDGGWSGQWAQVDHMVHVLTGRKTLRTCTGSWVARPGDTFFLKKGAYLSHFEHDSDMCLLVFFIPDEFVREVVKEVSGLDRTAVESEQERQALVIRVNNDLTLQAFLQAMGVFFAGREDPPELVLRLKLKELIASILVSTQNRELGAYFQRVATLATPLAEPPARCLRECLARAAIALPSAIRLFRKLFSQYTTFKQITDDINEARVAGGVHFRFDQEAGGRQGRRVGEYILRHCLRPALKNQRE